MHHIMVGVHDIQQTLIEPASTHASADWIINEIDITLATYSVSTVCLTKMLAYAG